MRILLAEDDDAMRTYLARALEKADYEVSTVDNGDDALLMIKAEHYDLLLSDIVMPGMDGIELSRQCRQISPKTKIMFITGFAAVSLRASKESPETKILSKPFHLRDLVNEVRRVFNQSSLA